MAGYRPTTDDVAALCDADAHTTGDVIARDDVAVVDLMRALLGEDAGLDEALSFVLAMWLGERVDDVELAGMVEDAAATARLALEH
ncbi:hypothetical protein ACWFQT_14175 [Cellulosimicrobium cellulans]